MNGMLKSILVIVCILPLVQVSEAQNIQIVEENVRHLDSMETITRTYLCNGLLLFPASYNKKQLKRNRIVIKTMNRFFDSAISISQFDSTIRKIRNVRVSRQETANGLLRSIKIIINSNYMHVELSCNGIDDLTILKKLSLSPNTNGRCDESRMQMLDYNFLNRYIVRNLLFKISVFDYRNISAENFLLENTLLAAKAHPGYSFSHPNNSDNEQWVSEILDNQFNNDSSSSYSYSFADRNFIHLIRGEKLAVLMDLLFSPNYMYSVHAMESLIYLESIQKIYMDERMRRKMTEIKNSIHLIEVEAGDVTRHLNGYKELNTSDNAVISKFKYSLAR